MTLGRGRLALGGLTLVTLAACGGAPGLKAAEYAPEQAMPAPSPHMAQVADGATAGVAREEAAGGTGESDGAYVAPAPVEGVKAGEWDDNANYRDFKKYLAAGDSQLKLDVSKRRFIVVSDSNGKAVPNCKIVISDENQKSVWLTTTASGRAWFFPNAEGMSGNLTAATKCQGAKASAKFTLEGDDGVVKLALDGARNLPQKRTVDVAFVLDTTGSMSEEIDSVKKTIRQVAGMLAKLDVDVRIGLVEFKDVTDKFTTRVFPMTTNVTAFAHDVDKLEAKGGGDTPEHVNEGLQVAVNKLDWSKDSVARLAFLIGDAPPHLDYDDDVEYTHSMRKANHAGIQIFTIAASGMDDVGQSVWREVAQYTGGTNMFVLRGGAGPQSSGAGDPSSSCGGTHENYASGNLDDLISTKIRITLKSLDTDPMLIAGLNKDELAKPCADRIVMAE